MQVKIQKIAFDLLQVNETEKLSDPELLAKFLTLLPAELGIKVAARVHPITSYRTQYNMGRLGTPKVYSFRYMDGIAVNRQSRPLSLKRRAEMACDANIPDERILKEFGCANKT